MFNMPNGLFWIPELMNAHEKGRHGGGGRGLASGLPAKEQYTHFALLGPHRQNVSFSS